MRQFVKSHSTRIPQDPMPIRSSADKAVSTPDKWHTIKHLEETVTLIVGLNKKHYTVHKDLLCFYSDYFRAAFDGGFKEAAERKIDLVDADLEVFEAFIYWLYTRRISEPSSSTSIEERDQHLITLAKLWVLGDRYRVPLLQNCAVDALLAKNQKDNRFHTGVLQIAYEQTFGISALRKASMDIMVFRMLHDRSEHSVLKAVNMKDWTKESLVDFAQQVSAAWDMKLPKSMPWRDKCYYHVHAEGEHC